MPFNDCASGSNEPNRVRLQNITTGFERDGFGSLIGHPALINWTAIAPRGGTRSLAYLATAIREMRDEGG